MKPVGVGIRKLSSLHVYRDCDENMLQTRDAQEYNKYLRNSSPEVFEKSKYDMLRWGDALPAPSARVSAGPLARLPFCPPALARPPVQLSVNMALALWIFYRVADNTVLDWLSYQHVASNL